jgi:hypothetical protein
MLFNIVTANRVSGTVLPAAGTATAQPTGQLPLPICFISVSREHAGGGLRLHYGEDLIYCKKYGADRGDHIGWRIRVAGAESSEAPPAALRANQARPIRHKCSGPTGPRVTPGDNRVFKP